MFKYFYCHSDIKVKEFDGQEERIIEGYFSTKDIDRARDIVLPSAFASAIETYMKNPILCFNHNWNEGIGRVISITIDDYGCKVRAKIAKGTPTADEVWTLISQGVYNAFSFAFRVLNSEDKVENGETYTTVTALDLLEVSVVTIPCNANATFSVVKGLEWGSDVFPKDFPTIDETPTAYTYTTTTVTGTLSYEQEQKSVENVVETKKEEVKDETKVDKKEQEVVDNKVDNQEEEVTNAQSDTSVVEENEMQEVEEKATPQFEDFPLMDIETIWSKTRARRDMAKYASSDGSGDKDKIDWKKYRKGFFWYDKNDPENFGSYKLPFCYLEEGSLKAVPRGIFSCAGAVNGARGGTLIPEEDLPAVKSHIEKYYKKMDRESPFKNLIGLLYLIKKEDNSKVGDLIEKLEMCEVFLNEFLLNSNYEVDDSDYKLIGEILNGVFLKEVGNE